ncbi:hypothetical protein DXT74_11035 [Chromobacterium sp. Rain0013]|nr:hypothetical protein DXT74_11035 [Chromobacterium sp. Rain0013]
MFRTGEVLMKLLLPSQPGGGLGVGGLRLEPIYDLLRVGDTALKPASKCSCTICTFRFLSRFRLVSP